MTDVDTPEPRKLRYPVMVELVILAALVLVLMIGLWMIRSLVSERSKRAESVRTEIASSWGQSQSICGPVLIVPFRIRYLDSYGKPAVTTERVRILPERLKTTGTLHPQRRHRGIFETVLYHADLRVEGEFARPDLSAWSIPPEDIVWSEAIITIGISDLRGIRGNPVLKWNGRNVAFSGGSGDAKLWTTGLTARVAEFGEGATVPFSFALRLNGSEEIAFAPLGGETVVELNSRWPDPSFSGAFLPEVRTITPNGFTARWSISSLARSYPQKIREAGEEATNAIAAIAPSTFGVGLISPLGHSRRPSAR